MIRAPLLSQANHATRQKIEVYRYNAHCFSLDFGSECLQRRKELVKLVNIPGTWNIPEHEKMKIILMKKKNIIPWRSADVNLFLNSLRNACKVNVPSILNNILNVILQSMRALLDKATSYIRLL